MLLAPMCGLSGGSRVRQLVAAAAVAVVVAAAVCASNAAAGAQEFISYSSDPRNVLEGSWQSCQDERGQYAERVYDHLLNGVGQFEVHLGPRREFAIFKGVQDEHRGHDAAENLLKPYRVPMQGSRAQHRWEVPSLNLAFTVTLGGGSRTDCESWYILLAPLDKRSQ
jgi:hypothetical protein